MNSKQASRYVKRRMNDELTNKILEHDGIKLPETNRSSSSNIVCMKCQYVNKLESKYCEKPECGYPLTQEAFEEIKKQEEVRVTEIVNKQLESKNQVILELNERIDKMTESNNKLYDGLADKVYQKVKRHIDEYRRQDKEHNKTRKVFYDMLDKQIPGWREKIGLGPPLTKEAREKCEQMLEQLNTNEDKSLLEVIRAPDSDDHYFDEYEVVED